MGKIKLTKEQQFELMEGIIFWDDSDIDDVEEETEKQICSKCKLKPDNRDCSSCEKFLNARDIRLYELLKKTNEY